MRTADRHTVPPGDPQAGPTARPTRILPCRPDKHCPPCDQPTLQPRQSPPAMRPASPCSPGNCRPPCDQPTLQTRQPPPARHAALPPYRPNRCRTAQAVPRKTDGCSTFTALPPPSTAKRNRGGHPEGPAVGRGCRGEGCNRKSPQPQPAGLRVAGSAAGKPASDRTQPEGPAAGRGGEWRGAIGRPAAVSGMGLRRVRRSFFAGFVPFASLNIRFEKAPTTPQPYFCFRKRFTPRPHTHQIQPVAAPRQRSATHAGGSRDRHPLRLEDSLPFRLSVRHPETHGSGCRFVGS